jgi:putative oxidoreductase
MPILRLVVGVLFVGHGAQKLLGLFGGGGIDAAAQGFGKGGLRPGRMHAVAAGCSELFEYNLVMIAAAFAVAGAGAGTGSLDGAFGLDVAGAGWGVGALLVGVLGGAAAVLTGRRHGAHRDTHHPRATPHSA